MKQSIVALVACSTLLIQNGCSWEHSLESLSGTYVPDGFRNNYDTITLKPDGSYRRIVCDSSRKLIRSIQGTWTVDGGMLSIEHFYLNLDDDLTRFPESAMDDSTHIKRVFDDRDGRPGFCVGYLPGENCYWRIP